MRKICLVIVSLILTLGFYSCKMQSTAIELVKKETVITNIYYTETQNGIIQTVECEDGHVAFIKENFLSPSDIGTNYYYLYPADLQAKKDTVAKKEFAECDVLSINEENGKLMSKMVVKYNDNSSEYYDLCLPGYLYEDISITGNLRLSKKDFYSVLKYNI